MSVQFSDLISFSLFSLSFHANKQNKKKKKMKGTVRLMEAAVGKRDVGFKLRIGQSGIPEAGRGLFLDGHAKKGDLISFFSGTVYSKPELSLASSMGVINPENSYIAALSSGLFFMDCSPEASSLKVFESCRARDTSSHFRKIITPKQNPFANAQMANHKPNDSGANSMFCDVDFSEVMSIDSSFLMIIPTTSFTSHGPANLKGLALVASRDITGEEIFVDYSYRRAGGSQQHLPKWF